MKQIMKEFSSMSFVQIVLGSKMREKKHIFVLL